MPAHLTEEQIREITEELVALRKKIQATGATILSPTPAWDALRKNIAALNKQLNADTKSKDKARKAAEDAESEVTET